MAEDATAVCIQQLQAIDRALDAYQRDHGELPPHLSDLYPQYVTREELFHCPADPSPGRWGVLYWPTTDPKLPVSYAYEMNADPACVQAVWLGPRKPKSGATWRKVKEFDRITFGDRVPVVSCRHHAKGRLNLTLTGQVYASQGNWEDEPGTVAVGLDRMIGDLTAGLATFTGNWSLAALEEYNVTRLDSPLPPALRYRLGTVANRLTARARELSSTDQGGTYRVAAQFYRASGHTDRALAACEEALRLSGDHAGARFQQAELGYRTHGRRGAPPLDAFVKAEMSRLRIPGASVAILRDGRVVRAGGYGLANVELSVPATGETVYQLGSVTKPFTATAIMLLLEEGKLSLEDRAVRFLPDLPPTWSEVTVRHLLTHTGGIKCRTLQPEFWDTFRNDYSSGEVLKLHADYPLEFPPGAHYAYSNMGYFLLGMIIESVSGKSYGEFLEQRVFAPLQMRATRINDLGAIIRNRATGYTWEACGLRNRRDSLNPTQLFSFGAIVSSVEDLARWDAALGAEQFVKRSSLEQMWTPATTNDGERIDYGLGWALSRYRGHRGVAHGGSNLGFSAYISRFPDAKLTVIVLTNMETFGNASALAAGIARFSLPALPPVRDEDPKATRMLKNVLVGIVECKADPGLFTPEAYAAPLPELKQASAFYESLGPLHSFRFIEQRRQGKQRKCHYLTRFGDTKWIHQFVLTEDGKIAELGMEPE